MLRSYRASGADLPFTDPGPAHDVGMEGYFWRFSDAARGEVVVALCGVNRSRSGHWATVALAGHPGGFQREAAVAPAGADAVRLGCWAGAGTFVGAPDRVTVDLGPDARLDVVLRDLHPWPRRSLGGSGLAQLLPGLGQYWHPHLLGGRADGEAVLGGRRVVLDGAQVYAEKNWGRGGFPPRWWWGQAQGFAREDVCVAFAGGDVAVGPASVRVTALAVRLGDTLVRLGDPVLSPVRADIGAAHWHLRARGPRWSVEVEASAPHGAAHVLPIPLPEQRRNVPGALEHLAGRLRIVVRQRGRVAFAGESALAGLEHGGVEEAAAELATRRLAAPEGVPA